MARFLVLAACGAALSSAAPSYHHAGAVAPVGIAAAAPVAAIGHAAGVYAAPAAAAVVAAPAVAHSAVIPGPTHVQEQVHAGPRTVQVGHQYHAAGQSVSQPPAYTVVDRPATNQVVTNAIPVPAVPVPAPAAAIPPAPRNLGPAPADTVVNEAVTGLGRTHTVVTPVRTQINPALSINKYQVDVPRPVPTPVERTVAVQRPVQKPYTVEVPVPVPVAVQRPVQKPYTV